MMIAAQINQTAPKKDLDIRWEKLPDDFQLDDDPVDNTGQPLLAGALRESLELANYIQPSMLIATNFGICATVRGKIVVKAPDWVFVRSTHTIEAERRSYTPHLQGEVPTIVMEFLSETEGTEYSIKRSYPPGKWFFYERILKVPYYAIFEPVAGTLEMYHLKSKRYRLQKANAEGRYWIEEMKLFLGVWAGEKSDRTGNWLRWWNQNGDLLLWGTERLAQERQQTEQERQRAEEEHQRAEQERQRAEQAEQQIEQLRIYLQSLGMNPDRLVE